MAVSPAAGSAGWLTGNTSENTYSTNCVTGKDYTENATAQYVGFLAPDTGGFPKVGDVYYVALHVAAVGNACPGHYLVHVQLHLPADTYPAVSSANPIHCYLWSKGVKYTSDSQGWACPTSPEAGDWPDPSSGWLSLDPTSSPQGYSPGNWAMAQGQEAEVDVPVFSTTPLGGLGDNSSFLVGAVTVAPNSGETARGTVCPVVFGNCGLDGPPPGWNFSGVPTTGPYEPVTVDYNPPTIAYPSPSSSSIAASTAHTTGNLSDYFVRGTVYTDLGTTTAYGTSHSDAIDGNYSGYQIDQDWNNLSGGTTYHWRLRFVPTGASPDCSPAGSAICGADQTFTTVPAPPASGAPGAGNSGAGGNGGNTSASSGNTGGAGGNTNGSGPGLDPEPPPPPLAPTPPVVAPLIVTTAALQGAAGISRSAATFFVSCRGAPGQSCPISAQLLATENLLGGKLSGVARQRHARTQRVVVGSANATVAAGQTQRLTVSLSRQGQQLVAKFGRLPVTLTVTTNSGSGSPSILTTQRLIFRSKPKKKGHHR